MDLDDPAVITATIAQALPPQEAPAKVAADQWASKPVASLEACQSPRIFPTYEALLAEVSPQAQTCGFGIVGLRSNNRNAAGQYTRIDLICERGTKHKQRGNGHKSADTRRVDCLWTAKAVMDSTGDWVFTVRVKDHNHAPASNAALIPAKKRLARRVPDGQRLTENSEALGYDATFCNNQYDIPLIQLTGTTCLDTNLSLRWATESGQ